MVKNPPANAGDLRDVGSIPGSGRSWDVEEGEFAVPGASEKSQSESFSLSFLEGLYSSYPHECAPGNTSFLVCLPFPV